MSNPKSSNTLRGTQIQHNILTGVLALVAVIYLLPIFIVVMNSFKGNSAINTATFAWPRGEAFVGWANYVKGMTFGNYPFMKALGNSALITVLSVILILLCTSMTAWYVARVGSFFSKMVYF